LILLIKLGELQALY